MKFKLIFIAILVVIFLCLVSFLLLMQSRRPAATTTQTETATQTASSTIAAQQIESTALPQIAAQGEVNPKPIGVKIIMPYALVGWSNDNEGGEALMEYVAPSGWQLVSLGGGAWDEPSLEQAGVPASIAQQLAGS